MAKFRRLMVKRFESVMVDIRNIVDYRIPKLIDHFETVFSESCSDVVGSSLVSRNIELWYSFLDDDVSWPVYTPYRLPYTIGYYRRQFVKRCLVNKRKRIVVGYPSDVSVLCW